MKGLISKSFLQGYMRGLNLGKTKRWPSLSDDKLKDYEDLRSDWENVGKNIREGTEEYKKSNH